MDISDIRGVIIDLDGTVYRGDELIPGCDVAIEKIYQQGLDIFFLTNEASTDRELYIDKLKKMGISIDLDVDDIITSASITAKYLSENYQNSKVFVVGETALINELRSKNLKITKKPEKADVLVVSMDKNFNYTTLASALKALNNDAIFVATNTDPTVPTETGEKPGTGTIVAAVQAMAKSEALIMGKPSNFAADMITKKIGADTSKCLLIGDRLETDIYMGEKAGMMTALVLTGSTSKEDIKKSDISPTYIINSLSDIDSILSS